MNCIRLLAFTLVGTMLGACSHKDEKQHEAKTVRVVTITVEGQGVTNSRTYSGTIEEGESSVLSFSTAGTIKKLNVRQGERVAQGQIIGTLDDSSLQSAYEIAQATLAQAQDAYDRMKLLHDANSLPEIKWVDVQQKLIQAQNTADIARNALDDAVLRAPFTGIIAEKFADIGQVAAPGLPVVKLVQVNDVKAVISVAQNQISSFQIGDVARVKLNDGTDRTLEGKLVEKGVTANSLSRTYDVKYRVDNAKNQLLPGMVCELTIENAPQNNVLLLPQQAVLLDEKNNNFVWLDSAGIARKRIVIVNRLNDEGLEITSGLNSGDKVIVKGMQKVSNGTKVESIG